MTNEIRDLKIKITCSYEINIPTKDFQDLKEIIMNKHFTQGFKHVDVIPCTSTASCNATMKYHYFITSEGTKILDENLAKEGINSLIFSKKIGVSSPSFADFKNANTHASDRTFNAIIKRIPLIENKHYTKKAIKLKYDKTL